VVVVVVAEVMVDTKSPSSSCITMKINTSNTKVMMMTALNLKDIVVVTAEAVEDVEVAAVVAVAEATTDLAMNIKVETTITTPIPEATTITPI
jgi:hypothetical protein